MLSGGCTTGGVAGYRKESADDGLPGGDEAACTAAFVPPD